MHASSSDLLQANGDACLLWACMCSLCCKAVGLEGRARGMTLSAACWQFQQKQQTEVSSLPVVGRHWGFFRTSYWPYTCEYPSWSNLDYCTCEESQRNFVALKGLVWCRFNELPKPKDMYMMPTYADRGTAHSRQKATRAAKEGAGQQMGFNLIWIKAQLE